MLYVFKYITLIFKQFLDNIKIREQIWERFDQCNLEKNMKILKINLELSLFYIIYPGFIDHVFFRFSLFFPIYNQIIF